MALPRSPANISEIPVWLLRTGIVAALVGGSYLAFELGRIQANYSIIDSIEELRAEAEKAKASMKAGDL